MTLDRTTYEAWLLDRFEGNLTTEQECELDAFLAANPDLNVNFHGSPVIDAAGLEPIDWKNELKKRLPPTGSPDAARLNEFLVARLEGDLDAAQSKELERFLYENPAYEPDAKRMAASWADVPRILFVDKASIERHFPPQGVPDKHRLTDFLIASQEGDLNKEQQRALDGLLRSDPEARKEQRLVEAAHVPSERIVFAAKDDLKKREVLVVALWQRYAIAASIALLLGFAWWVIGGDQKEGPVVAETEKVAPMQPAKVAAPNPERGTPVSEQDTTGSASGHPTDVQGMVKPEKPTPGSRPERAPAGGQRTDDQQRQERPMPSTVPIHPLPDPQLVEDPRPVNEVESPLAQDPAPAPRVEEPALRQVPQVEPALASAAVTKESGTSIGTVLANSVRNGVLETDTRSNGLDRDDALAMVNKGLGAITGGKGGVEVQRKSTGDRWKVRLGQHLSISANTGR